MKYKVGDLLTTGEYYYLVLVIEKDRYIVEETTKHHIIRWFVSDADNNKRLELSN